MNLNDVTSAGDIDERTYRHEQPVAAVSRSLELYAFYAAIFLCSMNYFRIGYIYFTIADLCFLMCFVCAVANANIAIDVVGRTQYRGLVPWARFASFRTDGEQRRKPGAGTRARRRAAVFLRLFYRAAFDRRENL
ncbi:hypothetical protein [Rhizobium gallicum]|uniref:hypothetical protein n=1 Tax=Rhizobium gallicum TaxID=56730 RepID=UPI001EF82D88|nr:hypothetical protein [Rhizobium gallicum]ULJ75108.1 hypothetical protein L2W42_33080 [Rhizobium gallicum]